MNRGSLAEDPREGLSSSSRYSRMGGERNSLLYVDSSSARKARKEAENRTRAAGGAAKGNHNSTSKKSVGRGLINSHMDRLEVGSDGRLFHVKENTGSSTPQKESVQDTKPRAQMPSANVSVNTAAVNTAPVNTASVNTEFGNAQSTASGQSAAKPVRSYLAAEYRNPLLTVTVKQSNNASAGGWLRRYRVPVLAAVLAFSAAAYGFTAWHYRNRFYPGTEFFGIRAAGLSVYDVKAAVKSKVDSYTLTLDGRDPSGHSDADADAGALVNAQNVITAQDIALEYVDDGSIVHTMETQKSWAWPVMMIARVLSGQEQNLETSFDAESVPEVLKALPCFQEENIIVPQNAKLTLTDDGAVVSPEVYGTKLKYEETLEAVTQALESGSTLMNLDQMGLYESPTVFGSDILLMTEAQALNKVLGAKITMLFGDTEEVINSEVIRTFLSKRDGSYYVDEEKVRAYVSRLAEKYDTYQSARTFYTSLGTKVELEEGRGDYGWQLDQESMYQNILDAVHAQKQTTLEPVWNHEAYNPIANDLSDTYVEISLTTQTMWFYKDGRLVVKTPVVTGNPYAGNETPSGGVWSLKDHMRNALLSGEGYRSPVDYWMPFNGGIGIHDMQSRYWFGGNVYLGAGSHGCINTPLQAVKLIYESIEIGVPVVVYKDESETAMSMAEGPFDSTSLKTQIEETYGTVEDDGAGSIVYWTAQKKAQAAAAAAASTTASAGAAGTSGGVW